MYYDSCYLYGSPNHIDHQYTYIIFTGKPDIWISCYDNYTSRNVFVYKPDDIIKKYIDDMDYTDFANGETRYMENNKSKKVQLSLHNAKKIVDILTDSFTN